MFLLVESLFAPLYTIEIPIIGFDGYVQSQGKLLKIRDLPVAMYCKTSECWRKKP
jgi:hypothetical protein